MRPLGESRFPFSGQKCPVTHGNQSRDSAAFPECVMCLSAGPLTRFWGQAPPAPDEVTGSGDGGQHTEESPAQGLGGSWPHGSCGTMMAPFRQDPGPC